MIGKEIWKDIVGLEGIAEVSSNGRVRKIKTGKILKPSTTNGYHCIEVCAGGKRYRSKLSRTVLHAFVGPPPTGANANHKNSIRNDDRLENLEWVTSRENTLHGFRNKELPTGVTVSKESYQANIYVDGVYHYLGKYKNKYEAGAAYLGVMRYLKLDCKYVERNPNPAERKRNE